MSSSRNGGQHLAVVLGHVSHRFLQVLQVLGSCRSVVWCLNTQQWGFPWMVVRVKLLCWGLLVVRFIC